LWRAEIVTEKENVTQTHHDVRKVRALFNPRSGLWWNRQGVQNILEGIWDIPGIDLTYQISRNREDGIEKAKRAVEDGVDTIIVVGGDGMVNTIGGTLINTKTALAVIPAGSGNGFARHFNIPLSPEKAAKVLKIGHRMKIDVGFAAGRPFFVTCGLAWDAELTRGFNESPIRGIIPYVFAGISGYFRYIPQNFKLLLDGAPRQVEKPMLFTVANLTQYGGGAMIAPDARPDDGYLVLVIVPYMDPVYLLSQVRRLFDGTISEASNVTMQRFKKLEVFRERPDPIQADGELLPVEKDFTIEVHPAALEVIVPEFWKLNPEK